MLSLKLIPLVILLAAPVVIIAFSAGAPAGYTGAPASAIDTGNNCTSCHGGTAQTTGMSISGFGAGNTYTPGAVEHLTVTVPASTANHGFEFTARLASTPATVEGTLTSTSATTQVLTGGAFITHTSAGNSTNTFTFDWTPPASNVGNIIFYAAGVSGFANVYVTTSTLTPAAGGGTPTLVSTPPSLSFNFQLGGTTPPAQTLNITSTGAALAFTAAPAPGAPWLSVSSGASGTTPASVGVSVNPTGLTSGTHNGTISITSSGASNSPLSVPVTLSVTTLPTMTVTPATLTFNYQIGSVTPAAQSVSVTSSGSVVNYAVTVSSGASWLSATPPSGATPGSINVSVAPTSLTAATYAGSVAVSSSGAGNSPQTIGVTLNVTGATTASATEGRRVFLRENCYGCHGGRAGGGMGPNLRTSPPALAGVAAAIAGLPGGMPSYPTLTAQDIANLEAYFLSLRTPNEPTFTIWWRTSDESGSGGADHAALKPSGPNSVAASMMRALMARAGFPSFLAPPATLVRWSFPLAAGSPLVTLDAPAAPSPEKRGGDHFSK